MAPQQPSIKITPRARQLGHNALEHVARLRPTQDPAVETVIQAFDAARGTGEALGQTVAAAEGVADRERALATGPVDTPGAVVHARIKPELTEL